MKKLFLILCLFASLARADQPGFEFDGLPLSDVVRLVYVQAYPGIPYFVEPAVLQDRRPVSFRFRPGDGDFRSFFSAFLLALGYQLEKVNKADVIKPVAAAAQPSAAEDTKNEVFVYRPKFRDGSYLVELVSTLFAGKFTSQRSMGIASPKNPVASVGSSNQTNSTTVAGSGSLLDQANKKNDQLIFVGSPREVQVLKRLFDQLDVDAGQVVVSAALYEVQTGSREASALQIALSLFNDGLKFNLGAAALSDNYLSFKNASVTGIMQALSTDSRFKVLSHPSLRVSSGASASLTVGQDVPVLGAVTYPAGGSSPVQSVDYRSSGVLFSIAPDVREGLISVKVDQQVSSFVQTTTGVNNSPTLTKRQVSTSVNVSDGDVVVIGGMREDKNTSASSGFDFLPSFFKAKNAEQSHTEILLFLQLTRV